MANRKISELTALTTPASNDELVIVDITASATKKITHANLFKTDTISELSAGTGVTIDGVVLKDSGITVASNIVMGDNSITGIDILTFTDVNGTIAGIANKNIVDKSATEIITGSWQFDLALILKEISTPGNPSAGYNKLYFKSNDFLYALDSDGNEARVGDVQGPGSSTNNALAVWNGTNGDTLKDSTIDIGNVVDKSDSETITGLWDFSTAIPTLPNSDPTTANQATRKSYVDTDNFNVFVSVGESALGSNITITEWNAVVVANFATTGTARCTVNCKVPNGATSISSIEIIYLNTEPSTNLLLLFITGRWRVGVTNILDATDAFSTYGTPGTDNNVETITVPSASYNSLGTLAANDIIGIRIGRGGDQGSDTYEADWIVIGVLFTFA